MLKNPILQQFFQAAEEEFKEHVANIPVEEWLSPGVLALKYQMEGIKQLKGTIEGFVLNGKFAFETEKREAEDET